MTPALDSTPARSPGTETLDLSAGELTLAELYRCWRCAARLADTAPRSTSYMHARAQAVGAAVPTLGTWSALGEVSPFLACAVIGAEDPLFFQHRGLWLGRVLKVSIRSVAKRRRVRGVSTISQQLARNLFLWSDRSMRRKLVEAAFAKRLEGLLTKARLLELYLNVVEWGEGVWGAAAASRAYFGDAPATLDPFQSAVLASLLPAPRRALEGYNLKRALRSQRRSTAFMYASGYLSMDELKQTLARVEILAAQLRNGTQLSAALATSRDTRYRYTPNERRPRNAQEVVNDGCGFDRRRGFDRSMLFGAQSNLDAAPLWWSGASRT
jgi:monofunctional biosynthetic peptidoglycan transglycosylase